MPKLMNHRFETVAADGQKFAFDSEIHVSTDGTFNCTVPEHLVPTLNVIGRERGPACSHYTGQLKVNHRAYAPSKASLLSFVDAAHADFYKVEAIIELTIGYDWHAEVSYFIRPDGSLCENGGAPGAQYGSGGRWSEHKRRGGGSIDASMNKIEHFAVGLYAAIYRRTTYRRVSGDTVKYERMYSNAGLPEGHDWAQRLNGFCSLREPKDAALLLHLPLTDEAARFFYDSLLAMCEIGRRFANFFGDEANVLAAIAGRGPSLLAPTATALVVHPATQAGS